MKFMSENIAVIGDSESIKGFCAIGLDIFPCESIEESASLLRRIANSNNYAIIFLTEELFNYAEKERRRYEDKLTPAIIPIPGIKGNTGMGIKRLSSFVEKAVGSDIIFNN